MFKAKDIVIYKRDICIIKEIIEQKGKQYYRLIPKEDESLIISVPIEKNQKNIRYPITKQEAESLIEEIPTIDAIETNDKLLEQEYKKLLKSETHEDLIKIIKTTYLRNEARKKNGKKATDKDLSYFNKAETYLYNELAIPLNMTYQECKNYIISKLSNPK